MVQTVSIEICDYGFIHVTEGNKSYVLARGIYWIDKPPYHPCVEEPQTGAIDKFLALGLYYPKERFPNPPNILTEMILRLKRPEGRHLAKILGATLAEAIKRQWGDLRGFVVIPVPKHPREKGGYNQAAELAREVADRLGLAYIEDAVIRKKPISSTKIREGRDFEHAVQLHLENYVVSGNVGDKVLIIDDVRTTGAL